MHASSSTALLHSQQFYSTKYEVQISPLRKCFSNNWQSPNHEPELGAIASIVRIAATGAQLFMVLFEFGLAVGFARTEVNRSLTEIP
jgi:hypothetical protein